MYHKRTHITLHPFYPYHTLLCFMTLLHYLNTIGVSSDRVRVVYSATESDKIIFRFRVHCCGNQ